MQTKNMKFNLNNIKRARKIVHDIQPDPLPENQSWRMSKVNIHGEKVKNHIKSNCNNLTV